MNYSNANNLNFSSKSFKLFLFYFAELNESTTVLVFNPERLLLLFEIKKLEKNIFFGDLIKKFYFIFIYIILCCIYNKEQ